MPPDRVHRFDVAQLGNAERTPQGFLRIPAYLTRVGVLEYRRADGTVVRELRPRDEVFRAQSLATLSAAPVTDLHPTAMVSPANVRELSIGHVSDHVKADGHRVAAHVTIQEANAIAAVETGKRRELSCGYACRIDATPGEYEGERYDQVQRDITYNHVAIGPANWGRAGRDIALRLDSAATDGVDDAGDVFRLDSADGISVAITASRDDDDGGDMELVTIRVDGIDVQVTKQAQQVIEKAIATRDDALVEATGSSEALQGRLDAALSESKKNAAAAAAAADPVRLDAQLNERFALVETARRVLPEHKYEGQSPRQIHEAVLKHLHPDLELKDRTDDYLSACFEQAMRTAPEHTSNLDDARRVTAPATKSAARADAREPVVPDWQKPLSYSKSRKAG